MAASRIEVCIDAPSERLWWACSTLEGLRSWQADELEGHVAEGATLEFRWPDLGLSAEVRVQKLEPKRRITLATPSWRLAIEVLRAGLTLELEGPSSKDEIEGALSGWHLSLALLKHQLLRHWGAPRAGHWFVRPVPASAPQLHAFFTDPVALQTWLGTSQLPIGAAGSTAQIQLSWGESLTGRVLAHVPERDLALSWEEQGDSVLTFRTLPSPRSEDERLLLLQWSNWSGDVTERAATSRNLNAALGRLSQLLACKGSA